MSEHSKGLVKSGFLSKEEYYQLKDSMSESEWHRYIDKLSDEKVEKMADEELSEEASIERTLDGKFTGYFPLGFPNSEKRYKIIVEDFNYSIESMYFWFISQFRRDQAFHKFIKVTDSFSAAEQSAFWGAAQTRLKIQQDNVSQYLVTIGKMIKDLFQIVRELRIIDERLEIYDNWDSLKSADVTLKGLYIDLVEGASKNPSSVYGLAQQVGFTILPDLFFNTHIYRVEDVDKKIDAMKYNKSIRNVLKRKIFSYINWKNKTDKELRDRKKFQLKYLRQHWVVIKMYMDWIKPYLRNIRRMQMNEKMVESVDIVSAFETSMTEIEFITYKPADKGIHPVVIGSFEYRTRPELNFQQDNYAHRGPVHVGRCSAEFRCYGWTMNEIKAWKNYRLQESFNLYSVIDESVKAAMDALGTDMERYLDEAGEPLYGNEKKEGKKSKIRKQTNLGIIDPFFAVFKGLFELFGSLVPSTGNSGGSKDKPKSSYVSKSKRKKASANARAHMWLAYKNYKKSRQMLTW